MYDLFSLYELLKPTTPEREQYLIRALKWSSCDAYHDGHPKLHQSFAQILWKGKNILQAANCSQCWVPVFVEKFSMRTRDSLPTAFWL